MCILQRGFKRFAFSYHAPQNLLQAFTCQHYDLVRIISHCTTNPIFFFKSVWSALLYGCASKADCSMKYIDSKMLRHRKFLILSIKQQVLFYVCWTRISVAIIFMTLQKKECKIPCKRKRSSLVTFNFCRHAVGDASMN